MKPGYLLLDDDYNIMAKVLKQIWLQTRREKSSMPKTELLVIFHTNPHIHFLMFALAKTVAHLKSFFYFAIEGERERERGVSVCYNRENDFLA